MEVFWSYLIFLWILELQCVELHEVPVELLHRLLGWHKHRHVLLQLGQETHLKSLVVAFTQVSNCFTYICLAYVVDQKSHHHLLDHCQEFLSSLLFHRFFQRLHCHLKCSFLWRSTQHLWWKTSFHLDIWKCQKLQNMGTVPIIEGMIRVNNLATGRFSLGPLVSVAARVTHLVHHHLI